jgi:hypothetical protein
VVDVINLPAQPVFRRRRVRAGDLLECLHNLLDEAVQVRFSVLLPGDESCEAGGRFGQGTEIAGKPRVKPRANGRARHRYSRLNSVAEK